MKTKIFTSLLIAFCLSLFSLESKACINPDTVVVIIVNYDTVTNAPFITNVEIRLTNLRLMNENNNKICSCALSGWATLFTNIDYVAFVDSGTNDPYLGFAKWNETVAASTAWNNSQPGFSWGGFVSDVINAGLSANDPVDLVIRASAPMGTSYTLLGDSTLGYNSLKDEIDQGALGTDEWSAVNNDLVASHQGVVRFWQNPPGSPVSYNIKSAAYFVILDNEILNNIPVGIDHKMNTIFNGVKEYPNPISDRLNIEFNLQERSDVQISVYSITGKKVKEIVHREFDQGQHMLSVELEDEINKGIYFIEYNLGDNKMSSKIVKQ